MNIVGVLKIDNDSITFTDGSVLRSYHDQDCCETHYLDFSELNMSDFSNMTFNIDSFDFFERINGYGIALVPDIGFNVRIPGYGYNNGYYSSNLSIILENKNGNKTIFDISDCQKIEG